MPDRKDITGKRRDDLLKALRDRFEANPGRHPGVEWATVQARLEANGRLWSLDEMERSGGEPDVVDLDVSTGEVVFVDCSAQSPKGRRSVCYDRAALDARREHKPKSSAMELAAAMGASLLTVTEYRRLQELGEFDTTTSSWVRTPSRIRKLGGRSSAIAATTPCSCTTTAPSRTMRLGDSAARSGSSDSRRWIRFVRADN